MPSPPRNVGIVFRLPHSSVWADLTTTISCERLEQSLSMTM